MAEALDEHRKRQVADFWETAACGEELYVRQASTAGYLEQARERYRLEPYIAAFADFSRWRGRDVLEVGVGLGADHEQFARAGARLVGIDITARAVEHVLRRFELLGLSCRVQQGDAERLAFPDCSFDLVYSWGVIHHTPDTAGAAREILRVLRPGGEFRVMIYHKWSLVGLMLWLRYAAGRLRPWLSLSEVYVKYLESPGTKAYTVNEARALFAGAEHICAEVVLTHGDLLESDAGQRHRGVALTIARRLWPRWILRRLARHNGLFLLISGTKPLA